jgi:predicted RNA-binding protein YlxR (DUF448 family)/ribosomal protein L7Ae-like RNA K-turn-binding protein
MDAVMRQCLACRKRDIKGNMMRIVQGEGKSVDFDPTQRQEGRGAYLCANADCLAKARSRHLIGAEFGIPDPPGVYLELAKILSESGDLSVESLIGFAVRSRRCVLGTTAATQAFHRNKIRLLVLSADAGSSTRHKMEGLAEGKGIPVAIFKGSRQLEAVTGKANCQVLGVLDGNFARKIQESLKRGEVRGIGE